MAEELKRSGGAAVRHSRRRNTVNLYTTIAAAVTAALGSLLSLNVLFNLSPTGLTVNGVTLYTPEQIQEIGGLVPGQNLVRLNTDFIEDRLKENLVYIDDVAVIKDYPDGLIINVTEAQKRVQIEYEDGYCTMSRSGRLLEIREEERNKKLPIVTGFELVGYETDEQKEQRLEEERKDPATAPSRPSVKAGMPAVSNDEQKTDILKELLDKLDQRELGKIAKIDLKDRADIKMTYDGRIQIELGSSVDLDIKLRNIQAVIDKLPDTFEGTLRFNSSDKTVSAVPKKADVPIAVGRQTDSSSDSQTDENAADITQTDGTYQQYTDDYSYDQYSDYNYDYDQGGWEDYNYNYDYNYDQNYGYDYGYDQYYDYGYDYEYY